MDRHQFNACALVVASLCSILLGCGSGDTTTNNYYGGTGGSGVTLATGGSSTFDFPIHRTDCVVTGDTVNCEEMSPRCASTITKCLPSAGSFPYSCAYTRLTGPNIKCACYEDEEKLCYTDAGVLGTQACIMDNDVTSHLDPNCVPIPQP